MMQTTTFTESMCGVAVRTFLKMTRVKAKAADDSGSMASRAFA